MQTTLRFPPTAATEIVQARPVNPIGEDHYRNPRAHLPPTSDDGLPNRERGAPPEQPNRLTILGADRPRPPSAFSWAFFGDSGSMEPSGGSRRFLRDELLASAAFQAQHLGSVPPYRNEPVLRMTAEGAYRTASALSAEIVGAYKPLDIRI